MKKITKSIAALSLVILGLSVIGCEKYEEGPTISLLSRKARVANEWKVEKAIENGEDVSSDFDQYELKLTKSGDAKLIAEYAFGSFTYTYNTDGTWEFKNNSEDLYLDFQDDDADRQYQILKLEDKELWLREKGEDLELHLMPK